MNIPVKGKTIDNQTRCAHYHSSLDIVAIKFKCCNEYYPCYFCHAEEAGHTTQKWPIKEFNRKAILCGNCNTEMTIEHYFNCNYQCPHCKAAFNPKCSNHNHLYFEE